MDVPAVAGGERLEKATPFAGRARGAAGCRDPEPEKQLESRVVPAFEPMSAVETSSLPPATSWRDYYELGKPRVVMLIMFTAIAGMFLAAPGLPPASALIFGSIGIALAASSAAAINHVLDR